MTRTISNSEINNSIQAILALTKKGDEVVLEENGNPVGKVTPIELTEKPEIKKRVPGLGGGKGEGYWMSDDLTMNCRTNVGVGTKDEFTFRFTSVCLVA